MIPESMDPILIGSAAPPVSVLLQPASAIAASPIPARIAALDLRMFCSFNIWGVLNSGTWMCGPAHRFPYFDLNFASEGNSVTSARYVDLTPWRSLKQ